MQKTLKQIANTRSNQYSNFRKGVSLSFNVMDGLSSPLWWDAQSDKFLSRGHGLQENAVAQSKQVTFACSV